MGKKKGAGVVVGWGGLGVGGGERKKGHSWSPDTLFRFLLITKECLKNLLRSSVTFDNLVMVTGFSVIIWL